MADKKITQLTELSILSDSDLLAGVDVNNNVTSKISLETLKGYVDTSYVAGTNITISSGVISAPNVYSKTEVDNLFSTYVGDLDDILDYINGEIV